MQLHIRHETRYRYDRPVKYSVQSLHLTPRRDASQRALTWNISAPGRRLEQVDAYGNISHLLTIEEPHREIHIVVSLSLIHISSYLEFRLRIPLPCLRLLFELSLIHI